MTRVGQMSSKNKRSSKRKRSDASYPYTAPPIVPAGAPLTLSPMPTISVPTTNSMLPNTQMSLNQPIVLPSEPDSLFDPLYDTLLAMSQISTSLETSSESTHLEAVQDGVGHGSLGYSDIHANVSSIPGSVGGAVPLSGQTGQIGQTSMPDNRVVRNGVPHGQSNDGHQVSRPRELEWVSENPGKTPTDSDKKRNSPMQRLTIKAGGACIWCFISKKECGLGVPCNRCREKELPCVRGGYSSLCMVLTIRHGNRYELDPDRFKKTQETLDLLKQDLPPFDFPVVVRWRFHDQQYREILISATDQLDLRQADTTLVKNLVDPAHMSMPVIRHPSMSEELSNAAHQMLSLLAAAKGLFTSVCFTEAVTIKTARAILFYLMAIYTTELCEVSFRLAKELYYSLNKKLSATEAKRYAIPVYIHTIDGIINLQWPNSLMSDILTHVQPRLRNLRELLHHLVLDGEFEPASNANNNFDSNVPQFNIMIELQSEIQETFVPAGFTEGIRQGQQRCTVNVLLRSDFDESREITTIHSQTFNPSWLSYQPDQSIASADYEALTALDSNDYPIFSNHIANSQNTEITYPPPDATNLLTSALESIPSTISSPVEPSPQDLVWVGDYLSQIIE